MSSIRVRAQERNGVVTVRALMSHPMETGTRKDGSGALVPAHFIETVTAEADGTTVMTALWSATVSRNPFFQFEYAGGKGHTLKLAWVDNAGESDSVEVTVS